MKPIAPVDDGRHPESWVEEWVFAAWTPGASLGVISGHRIVGRTAWYWAALARADRPLLHVADYDVSVRANPFVVKGEALWAEHICDEPMQQWTIVNETFASAFDDPEDALGRAYGVPTPIAFDLEWYATESPSALASERSDLDRGYEQRGVVHGTIEVLGEPSPELVEVPAHRWHRWVLDAGPDTGLGALELSAAVAHTGVRAPFVFPDGSVSDLVLTADGWAERGSSRWLHRGGDG